MSLNPSADNTNASSLLYITQQYVEQGQETQEAKSNNARTQLLSQDLLDTVPSTNGGLVGEPSSGIILPAPALGLQVSEPSSLLAVKGVAEPSDGEGDIYLGSGASIKERTSSSGPGSFTTFAFNPNSTSIIAIIGAALAQQALTSSSSFAVMWQQAFMNMTTEVSFAPIIAAATVQDWNSQASYTRDQANMSLTQGIVMAGAAIGTVAIGSISAYKESPSFTGSGKTVITDVNETEMTDLSNQNAAAAETSGGNAANSTKGAVSRGANAIGAQKQNMALFSKTIQTMMGTANMLNGGAEAITGFYNWQQQSDQAVQQQQTGKAKAVEEVGQQYANYFSQGYSRVQQVTETCQQQIDTATQIYKSVADGITQSVVSMFRG